MFWFGPVVRMAVTEAIARTPDGKLHRREDRNEQSFAVNNNRAFHVQL
jgi:hypothetical protein